MAMASPLSGPMIYLPQGLGPPPGGLRLLPSRARHRKVSMACGGRSSQEMVRLEQPCSCIPGSGLQV